jgi:hypothetical protein
MFDGSVLIVSDGSAYVARDGKLHLVPRDRAPVVGPSDLAVYPQPVPTTTFQYPPPRGFFAVYRMAATIPLYSQSEFF